MFHYIIFIVLIFKKKKLLKRLLATNLRKLLKTH